MPKYVLSVPVKPKLQNLLSVLRYRLPRFRGTGQNLRVVTFQIEHTVGGQKQHFFFKMLI